MTREPWLRHLLLVPLAPWTLARAAAVAPGPVCAALGILCFAAVQALFVSTIIGSTDSDIPPGLWPYLSDAWRGAFALSLLAVVANTVLISPLAWACSYIGEYRYASRRTRARFAAVWLTPLASLFPILLWYNAILLRKAPARPAWCGSSWFLTLTSDPSLLVLVALAIATFAFACHRLRTLTTTPYLCPSCRYSLRGLPPNSPCPECGTLSEP